MSTKCYKNISLLITNRDLLKHVKTDPVYIWPQKQNKEKKNYCINIHVIFTLYRYSVLLYFTVLYYIMSYYFILHYIVLYSYIVLIMHEFYSNAKKKSMQRFNAKILQRIYMPSLFFTVMQSRERWKCAKSSSFLYAKYYYFYPFRGKNGPCFVRFTHIIYIYMWEWTGCVCLSFLIHVRFNTSSFLTSIYTLVCQYDECRNFCLYRVSTCVSHKHTHYIWTKWKA